METQIRPDSAEHGSAPDRTPERALAFDRARAYLANRQCPSGGFCFYRTEDLNEPNLFDTWHAVAGFKVMGLEPPTADRIAAFVCAQPLQEQLYALFYRVRVLHLLHAPDPAADAVRHLVSSLPVRVPSPGDAGQLTGMFEALHCTLWLKRHFGSGFPSDDIVRSILSVENESGGFGTPSNLPDTAVALAALSLCGAEAVPRTREFVARMAVPQFDFRLTLHSLSPTLETACAGIECCTSLGHPIAYAADAVDFILACQTANGGFARAPGALPSIGLTHRALCGLSALRGERTIV